MGGKEVIVLDAEVVSVVSDGAFEARLANGHRFTAFVPRQKRADRLAKIKPGSAVKVKFSPYCMEQAEILFDTEGAEQ